MAYKIDDLKIYKLAERIEIYLHKLTDKFPPDEKDRMVDQIRRASSAISSNIVEGYGRYSFKEKIRYMHIARGESYELIKLISRSCKKITLNPKHKNLLTEK